MTWRFDDETYLLLALALLVLVLMGAATWFIVGDLSYAAAPR